MKYPQKQGFGGLCSSLDFLPAFYIYIYIFKTNPDHFLPSLRPADSHKSRGA